VTPVTVTVIRTWHGEFGALLEHAAMRDSFSNVGITIATNTALFTGLDLGQWIADTLSLWMLAANLIAAVIATAFGLALSVASRVFVVNSAG
jgi:hypothetical protein